jgi:putative SOS response-associated peptidase YedK
MCGRYILIEKIEAYEKRFNAAAVASQAVLPNYNVAAGALAPVITNDAPDKIQFFQFGLTPFWAKKPMYLINARAEGDHNVDDDPNFNGAKGIIQKPAFRKPIRSQRCLVICDFFIEGPTKEKLDKPFLVYLRDRHPFALAGIWDSWLDTSTGEILNSFAIITTTANELLQKIPHHRSPVILRQENEKNWLAYDSLADITSLLQQYPYDEMNAYPISTAIKNSRNNYIDLLLPTGNSLEKEEEFIIVKELELHGMGQTKRNRQQDLFS